MSQEESITRSSSTGHSFSNEEQLDGHFVFARPEYESILKSVGLQKGQHVLDAGCGVGSFLPLMSELVGENGCINAIDLAPENIDIINGRFADEPLTCKIETQVGSILELPYEDNTFDAVWNANVVQYLTDDQLTKMLAELQRVTKPGGIIAVKESPMLLDYIHPLPPLLWTKFLVQWLAPGNDYGVRLLRNETLSSWLRKSGLVDVWSKATLVERFYPLKPLERKFLEVFQYLATEAIEKYQWSEEELRAWQKLGRFDSPDHIFNDPDLYYREGHILAVGRKPG